MRCRVLVAILAVSLAGSALAGEATSLTLDGEAPRASAPLAALPPLAPLGGEALGATDSGAGTILMSALYGALAGALIGGGIGLLEGGNYGRDIAIGVGAGILVGAAFGAAHSMGDSRGIAATDGLNTTERYPVLTASTVSLGGRF